MISVNDNKSYKNPAVFHSVISTFPYNYKYEYTPARNHTQNPATKARQISFINNFCIRLLSAGTKILSQIHKISL